MSVDCNYYPPIGARLVSVVAAYETVIADLERQKASWQRTAEMREREVHDPTRKTEPLGLRVQRRDAARRNDDRFAQNIDWLQIRLRGFMPAGVPDPDQEG